jgi:acetyltransferase-like isoleucine patch superfamily enzyme
MVVSAIKKAAFLLHMGSAKSPGLTADWVKELGYVDVSVGKGTYGTPTIIGASREFLYIGNFVSISARVTIILANHIVSGVSLYPFRNVDWINKTFREIQNPDLHAASKGPVRIGNDVWLGNNCTVLPGVTIGDGAIVGASAVVSRDVPPYCVVAGNPAKVVKTRLTATQIRSLLQIKWWDWEDSFLESVQEDFMLDTDDFIAKYEKNGE